MLVMLNRYTIIYEPKALFRGGEEKFRTKVLNFSSIPHRFFGEMHLGIIFIMFLANLTFRV